MRRWLLAIISTHIWKFDFWNPFSTGERLSMAAAMAMFYHEVITVPLFTIININDSSSSWLWSPSPPSSSIAQPEHDDLRVIAVQLGQHPGPECPVHYKSPINNHFKNWRRKNHFKLKVWTANDEREDWLLAKFWFRNADAQVKYFHQLRNHH